MSTATLEAVDRAIEALRTGEDVGPAIEALRTHHVDPGVVAELDRQMELTRAATKALQVRKHCATCTCETDAVAMVSAVQQVSQNANVTPANYPGSVELPYGGHWLVPWVPEHDHRPKRGASSTGGDGCKFGDCTECRKADWRGSRGVGTAKFRVVNERWSTQRSLCDGCGRKLVVLPRSIPQFGDAAEAQAWLDKLTDELGQ